MLLFGWVGQYVWNRGFEDHMIMIFHEIMDWIHNFTLKSWVQPIIDLFALHFSFFSSSSPSCSPLLVVPLFYFLNFFSSSSLLVSLFSFFSLHVIFLFPSSHFFLLSSVVLSFPSSNWSLHAHHLLCALCFLIPHVVHMVPSFFVSHLYYE